VVIAVAVVAAVVVGGLLYWRAIETERQERAAAEFMQLEQTVMSGNTALASRDLQSFIGRFDGTDYGDEARLMLARVQLQAGQPAAAIDAVEDLAGGGSDLSAQAGILLGTAQAAAGDAEAAIATYRATADDAELDYQAAEALSLAAMLMIQANDAAGAAELYQRAAELSPEGSIERSILEMRAAEAAASARTASPAPAAG
jgi:predicted negative regulator of RcsB-dependent stress response